MKLTTTATAGECNRQSAYETGHNLRVSKRAYLLTCVDIGHPDTGALDGHYQSRLGIPPSNETDEQDKQGGDQID